MKVQAHNGCNAWLEARPTKILSMKICFGAELGKTAKYLILANFRLYGTCIQTRPTLGFTNIAHGSLVFDQFSLFKFIKTQLVPVFFSSPFH